MAIHILRKHTLCPRCGAVWNQPLEYMRYWLCSNGCGMQAQWYPNLDKEGYFINVDKYQVYWHPNGRCEIWSETGGTITLSDSIPFDVTLDMIKMVLVFS